MMFTIINDEKLIIDQFNYLNEDILFKEWNILFEYDKRLSAAIIYIDDKITGYIEYHALQKQFWLYNVHYDFVNFIDFYLEEKRYTFYNFIIKCLERIKYNEGFYAAE